MRPTEGLPLRPVAERLVDAALGETHGDGGDADPSLVEHLEELGIAAALGAEEVLGGDPAVREGDLVGVGGQPADLGVLLADDEARGIGGDDERGDLRPPARPGARHGGDDQERGDVRARVRDEGLRPVQHVLGPLAPGRGP